MLVFMAVKNKKLFEWKTDRWSLVIYLMIIIGNLCLYY